MSNSLLVRFTAATVAMEEEDGEGEEEETEVVLVLLLSNESTLNDNLDLK